jgi:hypothetical protein
MVEPNSPGSDSAAIKNAIGICFAIVLVSCVAGFFGQASGEIIRLDQKLDEIVSSDARVEKLAGGFGFVEGPVWDRRGGYLLFSDIPANVINTWTPDGKVSVLVKPSGFTGTDPSDVGSQNNNGKEVVTLIGSNGLDAGPARPDRSSRARGPRHRAYPSYLSARTVRWPLFSPHPLCKRGRWNC